jgi:hypothetical protein
VKEFIIAMLNEFEFFWQVVFPLLHLMDYLLPPQTFFAIIKCSAFTFFSMLLIIPFVVLYMIKPFLV